MSFAEVQQQVDELSEEDRRKLVAYIMAKRMKDEGEWDNSALTADEKHGWVSLDEVKHRLFENR